MSTGGKRTIPNRAEISSHVVNLRRDEIRAAEKDMGKAKRDASFSEHLDVRHVHENLTSGNDRNFRCGGILLLP